MQGFAPRQFPSVSLPDLEGVRWPMAQAWPGGPVLIALGHGECATTRLMLPYVDRIHRRRAPGTTALAILQDSTEEAREVVKELGLELPVYLEEEPFALSAELGLRTVPVLLLVQPDRSISRASEAFRRADVEACARDLGVTDPFFLPGDTAPELRPG